MCRNGEVPLPKIFFQNLHKKLDKPSNYNSFLVTPRIKRSTLVTLSVFPVVGTIVAERKKGIPEDLPQMGNLSESLVFKAFYALLILDP